MAMYLMTQRQLASEDVGARALEKRQALERWARHLTRLKATEASTAPALCSSEKQRGVNVGMQS